MSTKPILRAVDADSTLPGDSPHPKGAMRHGAHYLRHRKAGPATQPAGQAVPRRRTRRRISTEVLPLPRNGEFYTLTELGELTEHLVKMNRHYPAANPHWKPVRRRIRSSMERMYRKWRLGPPPILTADDDSE